MARPALFVLAARRRYLRRFLSPRNQQNPKRSLEKMKGAEGPGRGGPRGCGGRELAPDRRRPGGERARPWGVRGACRGGGRRGSTRGRLSSQASSQESPALSLPNPVSQVRLLPLPLTHWRCPRNADFFKAPLKPRPTGGQEISHLAGGGRAAEWGGG